MRGFNVLLAVIEMYLSNQETIRQKVRCILLAVTQFGSSLKTDIDLS